jgi:homocysteine S-methyltransferase
MSDLTTALQTGGPILTDGGIETRVMFETDYRLDPDLQVATMLSDPAGRAHLDSIYSSYVGIASEFDLPVVIGTPTFRASANFADRAGVGVPELAAINADAVGFQIAIREAVGHSPVLIAGAIGPSGDAYLPGQAAGVDAAAGYHRAQASWLADAGADFLFAATFPAVGEATGAARAMAETGLPFVISFVLDAEGSVLDGTALAAAVRAIDGALDRAPEIYSISCVHPSVAGRAIARLRAEDPQVLPRVGELKANGSPLPTDRLIELGHAESDPPAALADEIWSLFDPTGLRVLGGCCGTTDAHMRALAARMTAAAA